MDIRTSKGMINITITDSHFILEEGLYYKEAKISDYIPVITKYFTYEKEGIFTRSYHIMLLRDDRCVDEGEVPNLSFKKWHNYIRSWPEKAVSKGYEKLFEKFLRDQVIELEPIESKRIENFGWFKVDDGIVFSGSTSILYGVRTKIFFG